MKHFFRSPATVVLLVSGGFAADVTIGTATGRPTTLHVPASYDDGVPAPLVFLLHGCPSNSASIEGYFRYTPLSDEFGFLYVVPDGINQTWFGCAGGSETVAATNSAYLRALIDEVMATFNVNPNRVFLTGYSDGDFMAYRMACDHPDVLSAVVCGGTRNFFNCPGTAVKLLHLHGTSDGTISYGSGRSSAENWARNNGCLMEPDELPDTLNLVSGAPDPDTTKRRYSQGCLSGVAVEVWTIQNASHVPSWTSSGGTTNYARHTIDWLMRHPKFPCVEPAITITPESGVGPLEVTIDATGSTVPEGMTITSYEWDFGDGSVVVGSSPLVTHTYDTPGRQVVKVLIKTDDELCSARAQGSVAVFCPAGDLAPWASRDIGEPAFAGGAHWDAENCLFLCAGGRGLSGAADEFHYASHELEGDFVFTARVADYLSGGMAAEAGLMVRDGLEPGAAHATVTIRRLTTQLRERFMSRESAGASTRSRSGAAVELLPAWLRLERRGREVIGYGSPDGTSWTEINRLEFPALPPMVHVGIAAAGRDLTPDSAPYSPFQGRVCDIDVYRPLFRRGDVNADEEVDIADAIYIIAHLFLVGPTATCFDSADANDSGFVDLADPISVLGHLFASEGPLPAPFPNCGLDLTEDRLDCEAYAPCQ